MKLKKQTLSLFVAMMLLIGGSGAFGDTAFGDSLTAQRDAWCHQLQVAGHHYKCLAQSVRFTVKYDIPKDLETIDGHDYAIYWLGTNDSWFYNNPDTPEFNATYQAKFREHMQTLKQKGFKILLILPPTFPEGTVDTSGIRHYQTLYYVVARIMFNQDHIRLIDPDDYGYQDGMDVDLHPLPWWSDYFKDVIHNELQNWRLETQ